MINYIAAIDIFIETFCKYIIFNFPNSLLRPVVFHNEPPSQFQVYMFTHTTFKDKDDGCSGDGFTFPVWPCLTRLTFLRTF